MNILITGGAGYIGSITNRVLCDEGYRTVIFDNMSTGHSQSVGSAELIRGDLKNPDDVHRVFAGRHFDAVIHFAALALAGESMKEPFRYYENNILGGLNLLEAMRKNNVPLIIFSSTCAVYGYPKNLPVTESESYKPVSVYGSSKRMFEEILERYDNIFGIKHAALRYFNAAGAYTDGSLGEDHPNESHIIPIALSVAAGKLPKFELFGNDYDTPDGTCIRDYIHVMDLAHAHRSAAEVVRQTHESFSVNLGVGKGYSNLEVLSAVERVTGKRISYEVKKRRPGDPDAIYADNSKAKALLRWEPKYTDIESIVNSAWIWHKNHPEGFGK